MNIVQGFCCYCAAVKYLSRGILFGWDRILGWLLCNKGGFRSESSDK